jgi:hypothetical protein
VLTTVRTAGAQLRQPANEPSSQLSRPFGNVSESAVYYYSQAVAESLEPGSPVSVLTSRAGRLTTRILDRLITHTCGI